MTKMEVAPGPCGQLAVITAEKADGRKIKLTVKTKCKAINGMMEALGDSFDPMKVLFSGFGNNPFYEYAKTARGLHVTCPVLCAINKCIEAEGGLALKKDVEIKFTEE